MKKAVLVAVLAAFAMLGFATPKAVGKEKKAATAKQWRWHGIIVRINKDDSTLDVRKGAVEKRIHYDSNTKWTKGKATVDMSEIKENDDVICLGTTNEKGDMVATRVDLRPPK